MKYFENINTLDELKKAYRRLAMQHHPDCGGSTEAMQEINNEHDALFEILKRQHNAQAQADTTGKTKATTETAEEFRQILDILLRLDGLEIELCGSWLWIGGNTKANKDKLKAAGCKWSKNKVVLAPRRGRFSLVPWQVLHGGNPHQVRQSGIPIPWIPGHRNRYSVRRRQDMKSRDSPNSRNPSGGPLEPPHQC